MKGSYDFTPIFVVGSARSGTTILGRMLSAHPDFYVYRAETLLMEVAKIKYGDIFKYKERREAFIKDWFDSRQFKRSNLTKSEFLDILSTSNNYSELLVSFLRRMALKANRRYIVDSTPSNIFSVPQISAVCPQAIFIRIVRDGRDVAISQVKLGWSNPPAPFRERRDLVHYALLVWQQSQDFFENNSLEAINKTVFFEDLISNPDRTFRSLGSLIGEDFTPDSYESVLKDKRNTAFEEDSKSPPVERWKNEDYEFINDVTFNIGKTLRKYGYVSDTACINLRSVFRYYYFLLFFRTKRMISRYHRIGKFSSQEFEREP